MVGQKSAVVGWWLVLSLVAHLAWLLSAQPASELYMDAVGSGAALQLAIAVPVVSKQETLIETPTLPPALTPRSSLPARSEQTAQKPEPDPLSEPAQTSPQTPARAQAETEEPAPVSTVSREPGRSSSEWTSPIDVFIESTPAEPVVTQSPRYAQLPERPSYPPLARRRGWEGEVWLEIAVAANGDSSEPVLLRSSGHPLLDQSALAVARQWRFVPEQRNGQPVPTRVQVPVNFALR